MPEIQFIRDTGTGTPLVLIHAFPFNADMWEPQREALSGQYRVVTFDLPGFGRDKRPGLRSLEECADAVAAMLDALHIDRCMVGGCSMGGYILMAFLRRYADRVLAMILADTRGGADSEEAKGNRYTQAAAVRASGMNAVVDGMLPKLLSEASKSGDAGLEIRVRSMMMQSTPEATARMLEAMAARSDSFAMLSGLVIPACVIVGAQDVLTPPAEAQHLAEVLAAHELHIVDKAGHLTNLEAPEDFNRIVSNFIELHIR